MRARTHNLGSIGASFHLVCKRLSALLFRGSEWHVALYKAKTEKLLEDSSKTNQLPQHLVAAAEGCRYLYLWLDCDREGENICFEVISILRSAGLFLDDDSIYRAHFSALTQPALRAAYAKPRRPNAAEAMAVDARQELDLKIGCSFTRFLTRQLLEGAKVTFSEPKLSILSFGPCQTPTLAFCVRRHEEICAFVPRPFWRVAVTACIQGCHQVLRLAWGKRGERTFNKNEGENTLAACRRASRVSGRASGKGGHNNGRASGRKRASTGDGAGEGMHVHRVSTHERRLPPPTGLDTVQMLRAASAAMSLSPHKAMQVAEQLYMSGLISYPRTESSRYPPSFDVSSLLKDHATNPIWGEHARRVISANGKDGIVRPPRGGKDAGDHPPITPMRSATSVPGGAMLLLPHEMIMLQLIWLI